MILLRRLFARPRRKLLDSLLWGAVRATWVTAGLTFFLAAYVQLSMPRFYALG